jgi:uncharacterized protein YhbP (UPF0306 family)
MNSKDKKILQDYLGSQRLMAMATQGKHAWITTVYYVSDDNLNLYFISPPKSEHSQHLKENNEVACAIADSHQNAADPKVGLQLYGTASEEKGLHTIKWMLKMYNKLYPASKEKFNFKNFESKMMSSRVYKVTPKKIKLFNQELFKDRDNKEEIYLL